VYIYTYSLRYRDAGRAKEIKKNWDSLENSECTVPRKSFRVPFWAHEPYVRQPSSRECSFIAGHPAVERTTSLLCDRSYRPSAPLCPAKENILPLTHGISRAFSLVNVFSTEVLNVSFVPLVVVCHSHAILE